MTYVPTPILIKLWTILFVKTSMKICEKHEFYIEIENKNVLAWQFLERECYNIERSGSGNMYVYICVSDVTWQFSKIFNIYNK